MPERFSHQNNGKTAGENYVDVVNSRQKQYGLEEDIDDEIKKIIEKVLKETIEKELK